MKLPHDQIQPESDRPCRARLIALKNFQCLPVQEKTDLYSCSGTRHTLQPLSQTAFPSGLLTLNNKTIQLMEDSFRVTLATAVSGARPGYKEVNTERGERTSILTVPQLRSHAPTLRTSRRVTSTARPTVRPGPAPRRATARRAPQGVRRLRGGSHTHWWKERPRSRLSTVSRVLQPTAEQLRVIFLLRGAPPSGFPRQHESRPL